MFLIENVLRFMEAEKNLILPYGFTPNDIEEDEASWDAYQWNPPIASEEVDADPDASEKPSWETLSEVSQEIDVFEDGFMSIVLRGVSAAKGIKAWAFDMRNKRIEDSRIPLSAGVFRGILPERIVNLTAMAMMELPEPINVFLKDDSNVLRSLNGKNAVQEYLAALIPIVNNAHNDEEIVVQSIQESLGRIENESLHPWERIVYAKKIIQLNESREEAFKTFFVDQEEEEEGEEGEEPQG